MAERIHQEETILGGGVTLSEHRAFSGRAEDVGNAEAAVPAHHDVVSSARMVAALDVPVRHVEGSVLVEAEQLCGRHPGRGILIDEPLLPLVMERGMHTLLARAEVRLLDFKKYALSTSEAVKEASLREAEKNQRPVRYLQSAATNKEALVKTLLHEHPIERGLICAFRTVEPCMSFEYHRSADPTDRGLKLRPRKCLHIYKYYLHPLFGLLGARLQTWFPFNIQIWLNGREWLARQLQRRGRTDFTRLDNCFTSLGDPALAQRLLDRQLTVSWKRLLDAVARDLNPLHARIFRPWPQSYYWSAYQTEWATDLLFRDTAALGALYPALVRHAMLHFQSADVMRFLGRKGLHGRFEGELTSRLNERREGVRVKHWADGNFIKMYDKAGSVLRIETTIGKTTPFKVFRPMDGPRGKSRKLAWRPLRKGIADLHRRAQVSQRSNDTYLDALAAVDDSTRLGDLLDRVSSPVTYGGRRVRALRVGDHADLALLKAISRGEFATAGFRNRDLRRLLHSGTRLDRNPKALSAKVSRQLRLLRAHGIIKKIPKSHRYRLTTNGQLLTAALFAVRDSTLQKLVGSAVA